MNTPETAQPSLFDDSIIQRPEGWFANALAALNIKETSGWPDAFGDALCRMNHNALRKKVKGFSPTTNASLALGWTGFMNAAFGLRFAVVFVAIVCFPFGWLITSSWQR